MIQQLLGFGEMGEKTEGRGQSVRGKVQKRVVSWKPTKRALKTGSCEPCKSLETGQAIVSVRLSH